MSKKVKTLAITGNKLIDGLLATFISLIILGICLYFAKIYGSPVFWWQIFGGIWASILVGIFAVGLVAGFSLFVVGLKFLADWWYEKVLSEAIDKNLFLAIIYTPTLLTLAYLVARGTIPYQDFLDFLKWFVMLICSVVSGYIIGHFTK